MAAGGQEAGAAAGTATWPPTRVHGGMACTERHPGRPACVVAAQAMSRSRSAGQSDCSSRTAQKRMQLKQALPTRPRLCSGWSLTAPPRLHPPQTSAGSRQQQQAMSRASKSFVQGLANRRPAATSAVRPWQMGACTLLRRTWVSDDSSLTCEQEAEGDEMVGRLAELEQAGGLWTVGARAAALSRRRRPAGPAGRRAPRASRP